MGAVPAETGRLGRGVVHAGDDEPVAAAFDDDVAVVQRSPAELVHVVEPALRLAEVLVVAGDVDTSRGGLTDVEWTRLFFAEVDRAVSDVAEVAHNVGAELR